jgi:hypothetical protein
MKANDLIEEKENRVLSRTAANDNKPRMAFRGEWVGDTFWPESSQARLDKDEVEAKRKAEKLAIHKERARLAIRMKIGKDWDGKADNDNPSLPIIKALLADGNHDLLPALLLYRRLEAAVSSEAQLVGNAVGLEPLQVEQDLWIDEKTGKAMRKGAKGTKKKDALPWSAKASDPLKWCRTKPLPSAVPTRWGGDGHVIAKIDAVPLLQELRALLGPLVEPFEAAALHGATLERVGMLAKATSSRSAMAVGRSVVHLALSVIRDRAGPITYDDVKDLVA